MYKKGFTLSEILISLVVIGIVAALTIPNLIQSYKERQYIIQLKKVYAQLSQAFQMAVIEHGPVSSWGIVTTQTGEYDEQGNQILDATGQVLVCNYLGKYLKKASIDTVKYDKILSLDGRVYSSNPFVSINADAPTSMILADGTYVGIGWVVKNCNLAGINGCGDIAVILPGKIQTLGKNYFYFKFTPYGIVPDGTRENTQQTFPEYCDINNKKGIKSNAQGRGCTAWVIEKGNMDYLRCDDLSWDGKDRCSK